MKWFRFWTDTVNDVKMLQLSDYEYRMWTYLLSYASEVNSLSGELQTTFKLLSLHFHQRFNLFSRAIETFQKLGLISVSAEGYVTITNWSKRQFKSDNSYDRVKKYREVTQKRNVSNAVSETAPDTDTDTDTEKDKRHSKKTSSFVLPVWVPEELWKAYLEIRKKKRATTTNHALNLCMKTILKLQDQGHDRIKVIEQSVERGWVGFFELRENGDGTSQGHFRSGYRGKGESPGLSFEQQRDYARVQAKEREWLEKQALKKQADNIDQKDA